MYEKENITKIIKKEKKMRQRRTKLYENHKGTPYRTRTLNKNLLKKEKHTEKKIIKKIVNHNHTKNKKHWRVKKILWKSKNTLQKRTLYENCMKDNQTEWKLVTFYNKVQ